MRYIANSTEMKEIENYVINEIGIPSLVLMERAALGISERIKARFGVKDKICVVCGNGNNGADGVAIARQLLEANYKVSIVVLGQEEKFSREMKTQLSVIKKLGVLYFDKIPDDEYSCFVDALFGIGLTRNITDKAILAAIKTINSSDAYIYSVDIPSGIHTDTGCVMGKAVKADETITFTCEKVGLCIHPGKEYAGRVTIHNIGIMNVCMNNQFIGHYGPEESVYKQVLKEFTDGNKGTYGKVAVIAGNNEISGAAVLCAKAAMKCGAGMVKVLSNDKTLNVIRTTLPEVMVDALDEENKVAAVINRAINWADCVVIGPGIGTDECAYLKMESVLRDFPKDKKLIIDADGINLLAKYSELKSLTEKINNIVYTPHMMELSRLTGIGTEVLKTDLDKLMSERVSGDGGIYVCKDSVTRVYAKDKPVFINRLGNSGMATAGCGDVLAGIIAAFVARCGVDLYEGTVCGVYLHSYAGDLAAKDIGKNSLMAGDIIEYLPIILRTTEERS